MYWVKVIAEAVPVRLGRSSLPIVTSTVSVDVRSLALKKVFDGETASTVSMEPASPPPLVPGEPGELPPPHEIRKKVKTTRIKKPTNEFLFIIFYLPIFSSP